MKYGLSLEERKRKLIEDCCGGAGGGDGYSLNDGGMAIDTDPTPALQDDTKKRKLNKFIKKKKQVEEGKKDLPVDKMILKASQLESNADKMSDREKKFPLYDRSRKIRSQIK